MKNASRLVWVLVAVVLAIAAWRLIISHNGRIPDQQQVIHNSDTK